MNYIKQSWNAFAATVKANKLMAAAFFVSFFGLGIWWSETGGFLPVIIWLTLLMIYATWIHRAGKLFSVVLSFMLLAPPARPQQAGQVACAVAVVAVGTAAVVYVCWFCKKYYPKPKTNVVEELTFTADGSSAAAMQVWFCDYCPEPPDLALGLNSPSGDTLVNGTVTQDRIALTVLGTNEMTTSAEFQDYLLSQGLPMQFGTHYARDGIPCDAGQVPIRFVEGGSIPCVVIEGADMRTNVVERSTDLATWTPLLTNVAPAALRFSFTDNSDAEQAFYRVR